MMMRTTMMRTTMMRTIMMMTMVVKMMMNLVGKHPVRGGMLGKAPK